MLFDQYEQSGLLFNTNFKEMTSEVDVESYRGELVLIEGGIADDKGHLKPPIALLRHAVLLSEDNKLTFVVGCLDELSLMEAFVEKFKTDFSTDMQVLLFVVNIIKPAQVEVDGVNFILIPLSEGVAWNELIDELALEKSDLKGQSPADKIVTAYKTFKNDYSPKYERISFEAALASVSDIQREVRGAV